MEAGVETGVPQGSLVLPILFVIYFGGVFREVKAEVKECIATLFVDNKGWLGTTHSVEQLCERQATERIITVEC